MQRSAIDTLRDRTATAGDSPSPSGSNSEDSNPETSLSGSRKRKRSLAISYVGSNLEHRHAFFGQDGWVLIDPPGSCELCKKRKVKCGRLYCLSSALLLTLDRQGRASMRLVRSPWPYLRIQDEEKTGSSGWLWTRARD